MEVEPQFQGRAEPEGVSGSTHRLPLGWGKKGSTVSLVLHSVGKPENKRASVLRMSFGIYKLTCSVFFFLMLFKVCLNFGVLDKIVV